MEGYDQKNCWKLELLKILLLYPSTKIGKTLMFFEQIKKFQCLKSSTRSRPSEDMWQVSHGHKRVLKLGNFSVQNLQKPHMIDLGTQSPLICDALWSFFHIGGLWLLLISAH